MVEKYIRRNVFKKRLYSSPFSDMNFSKIVNFWFLRHSLETNEIVKEIHEGLSNLNCGGSKEDCYGPTIGWVQICEPLFLRFWAPMKILVLLALYIKNNSRKVDLNMCRNVRCKIESPIFYAFECHSKFFV